MNNFQKNTHFDLLFILKFGEKRKIINRRGRTDCKMCYLRAASVSAQVKTELHQNSVKSRGMI